MTEAWRWKCRDRVLDVSGRPLVMGILNVTPDSFSDGGAHYGRDKAVAHGLRLAAQGADIVDVGGESTRPGAATVPAEEEARRVVPVIEALCKQAAVAVSVDTMKAEVARRALEAGACIVNDVSALTHDAAMPALVCEYGAGAVLMHMRGTPRTMQSDPQYEDVVEDVCRYLRDRIDALVSFGLDRETLAVDPGIGFGKTVEHNVKLLARLERLRDGGAPVVVGLSRKSFLGRLAGREVGDRLAGSLAALTFCVLKGAHVMRVHDVEESCDAARIAYILKSSEEEEKNGRVDRHRDVR